jgi:hypothetical protein
MLNSAGTFCSRSDTITSRLGRPSYSGFPKVRSAVAWMASKMGEVFIGGNAIWRSMSALSLAANPFHFFRASSGFW